MLPAGAFWASALAVAIVAVVTALAGQTVPAFAAGCSGSGWEDGVPVFAKDCTRTSLYEPGGKLRRLHAAAKPLQDLRKGDVPFRSQFMLDAIEQAIGRYKAVVRKGGWPKIHKERRYIRPGDDDDRLRQLRRRLIVAGDLDPRAGSRSTLYDESVVGAVKRFQRRHGLRPNGVIGSRTLASLNVSAQERLHQLRINYRRIADLTDKPSEPRYVLVNIPAFQLEAVSDGRVVQRHRVIVGKRDRQTPSLKATIRGLNFFPYWRVPDSIAHRDLIPRLQKEPDYLDKEHIRVLDGFGGKEIDPRSVDWSSPEAQKYKFRQDPGPFNALGLVRIDMPNEHIVYLHDTPMKRLFNQRGRSFSSGCVRVQNVFSLVKWIASSEPGWDENRVDDVLGQGVAETLKLTTRVPVYFTYITAWVDPNGPVQFRADIYGRDGRSSSIVMAAGENGGRVSRDSADGPPPPQNLSP